MAPAVLAAVLKQNFMFCAHSVQCQIPAFHELFMLRQTGVAQFWLKTRPRLVGGIRDQVLIR
jgi:hypothetical protein